jgi:hypothetical protein
MVTYQCQKAELRKKNKLVRPSYLLCWEVEPGPSLDIPSFKSCNTPELEVELSGDDVCAQVLISLLQR